MEKNNAVVRSGSGSSSSDSQAVVSRKIFLIVVGALVFTLLAVTLGLGLGLGLKVRSLTRSQSRLTGPNGSLRSTASNFNYSSFYGIPDHLPKISSDKLFNDTELNLKTGFVVSDVPTLREYTLNISQALAAPDGKKHRLDG